MSKDNVTPAFPTLEEHGFNSGMPGMSLRDYFAAKAMQSFLNQRSYPFDEDIATDAYEVADLMLEARKS